MAFITPLPLHHIPRQQPNLSPRTHPIRHPIRQPIRRPRINACINPTQPPSPEFVRSLLTATTKAEQQKGLLLVRNLPPTHALELLHLCLSTSKNDFIRATAAISIGELKLSDEASSAHAIRTLQELIATDEDYSVRAAAAAGLGYVSGVTITDSVRGGVIQTLRRAVWEDAEWQVQFSALAALGNLRDARAVPLLTQYLDSDNDLLVQAAVGALGDIGEPSVIPELLELLGCKDMMTRQRLAQALTSMSADDGREAVIDALRTLSRDQSFAVRDAALEGLRKFGCEVEEEDDELIEKEVMALMEGDEMGEADVSAGEARRRRLERSFEKPFVGQGREEGGESDEEYEKLVGSLSHGSEGERVVAAIKLRSYEGGLCVRAVEKANGLDVAHATVKIRSLCVGLLARGKRVDLIVRVLQNDLEQNVRSACCDALMDVGGDEAVAACVEAFGGDKHWLVRVSAAIALGNIGKDRSDVEDVLITCLEPGGVDDLSDPVSSVVRRHAVTALGFLGCTRAVSVFEQLLRDESTDDAVRYRTAAALRGIPCDESVQLVRELINDGNKDVAEMARGSLDALVQSGLS